MRESRSQSHYFPMSLLSVELRFPLWQGVWRRPGAFLYTYMKRHMITLLSHVQFLLYHYYTNIYVYWLFLPGFAWRMAKDFLHRKVFINGFNWYQSNYVYSFVYQNVIFKAFRNILYKNTRHECDQKKYWGFNHNWFWTYSNGICSTSHPTGSNHLNSNS